HAVGVERAETATLHAIGDDRMLDDQLEAAAIDLLIGEWLALLERSDRDAGVGDRRFPRLDRTLDHLSDGIGILFGELAGGKQALAIERAAITRKAHDVDTALGDAEPL